MKKNKYIKIFLFLFLIIVSVVFLYQYFKKVGSNDPVLNTTPKIEVPKLSPRRIINNHNISKGAVSENVSSAEVETNSINIKIIVEDKVYESKIKDGDSVYQAMLDLSIKNKDFTFTSKDYSGMGMFVDSINGIQGSFEKNWIYYVNDKKASIGISKNLLKEGDIVLWKREGLIN